MNVTEHKMCVVIFICNFCLKHFSFYGKFSEILSKITQIFTLSMHYPCHVLMKRFFPTDFRRVVKHYISAESVHWKPSCSIRTDRRTGMTKLIVAIGNFANSPKNDYLPVRTQQLLLYNEDSVCLPRDTNQRFKYNPR